MPVIHLYAGLRKTAGVKELRLDGDSVGKIIIALVDRLPVLKPALLDDQEVRKFVTIAVNGHNISLIEGMDTPVEPNDQIAIFPPLAGG